MLATKRLKFFAKYLENGDQLIADDAFQEFGQVPYDVVAAAATELSAAKLCDWIADASVPNERKGFYGLSLGLTAKGDESAAEHCLAKKTDRRRRPGRRRFPRRLRWDPRRILWSPRGRPRSNAFPTACWPMPNRPSAMCGTLKKPCDSTTNTARPQSTPLSRRPWKICSIAPLKPPRPSPIWPVGRTGAP